MIEADPALGRPPTVDEIAFLTGDRVGKNWARGRAFLDTHFVLQDLEDLGLLRLFRTVWNRNSEIVPVARLTDLLNPRLQKIRCDGSTKLAVLVRDEEVNVTAICEALKVAGLEASDCVIFVDFTGAPLNPEIATGSVSGLLDSVSEVGRWQRVIFQGSNFPIKPLVAPGEVKFVPRYEWDVFHAALKECGVPPAMVGYGDFGADHGTMKFSRKKGGGRPHRQLRYTTTENTMIVRGNDAGADAYILRDVCNRIVESGHFAGQAFSEADDRIYCLAKGLNPKPGSASNWREWNMLHHMTRVVRDLGAETGLSFSPGSVTKAVDQQGLFAAENQAPRE